MLVHIANAHAVVGFVVVADRRICITWSKPELKSAADGFEASIGVGSPGTASRLVGAAVHGEELSGVVVPMPTLTEFRQLFLPLGCSPAP